MRDVLWIALLPLSWVWGVGAHWVGTWRGKRSISLGVPTVSVGNIHSGGSGKTPLILEVLKNLKSLDPVLVTRGYSSKQESSGAELDRTAEDGPKEFGDEPWMIAQQTEVPVLVGKHRRRWTSWFQDKPHRLAVLDDGFQHRQLHRDVDLVLISNRHSVDESFCLPLGQLREPLGAVKRASALLLLEEDGGDPRWPSLLKELAPGVPQFAVRRTALGFSADGQNPISPPQAAVAFAGIAWPEGFFSTLRGHCNVLECRGFPDHHEYQPAELRSLLRACRARGASLVTTDKDWYKVSPWFKKEGVAVYSLKTQLTVPAEFWPFLQSRLEGR